MAKKKSRPKHRPIQAGEQSTSEVQTGSQALKILPGLVLLLAFISRIYYLYLTADQPVWWDEANYLVKAKGLALGTPTTGYDSGRPILFSIFLAPFFSLKLGELGIRIALSLSSWLSIFLTYRIGTRLLGPWVGIMGAALFSCHYLNLFYTERIMCEIPYVTMALLGLDFFLSERPMLVRSAGLMFAVSVMLRYPAFIIPVCLLAVILITERTGALRKKDYWISAGLAIATIAPDLLLRGLSTIKAVSWMMTPRTLSERLQALVETTKVLYGLFDPVSQIALIAGLLLTGWYLVSWKSRQPKERRAHLLLFFLLAGPLLLQGLWITHLEDRYLFWCVVPAFLLIGTAYWHLIRFCPQQSKDVVVTLTVAAILYSCGTTLRHSHTLIVEKASSYEPLRIVGAWLKQQKDSDAVVISQSVAQLTYYSERRGVAFPPDKEEFVRLLASGEAEYAIVSGLETHPDWVPNLDLRAAGLDMVMVYPENQPQIQVAKRKPK